MIKINMDRNCKSYKIILHTIECDLALGLSANDNFLLLFKAKAISSDEDIPTGLISYY
jgi:hypothetical protein